MKNSLLVFGTKNFNNSLSEIKEYLDFSLIFFNEDTPLDDTMSAISIILVDSEVCGDQKILSFINSINYKPTLLIQKNKNFKQINCTDKIITPLIISDFNTSVINLITSKKFSQNSSVEIKEYKIDKNEKKLKKNNMSITITEREIQLIELLFKEKKPLSKNSLLKRIWKYSDDADTHTVETHIYRLRKKILYKFNDEKFIISSKTGYSI